MASKSRRSKGNGNRRKDKKQRGFIGRWFRRLFMTGLVIGVAIVIALVVSVALKMQSLPSFYDLKQSTEGQKVLVRAIDGTEIMELGPSFGEWLDIDDIPQVMVDAMISVEDRRFYMHPGVDPKGVARAFYANYQRGSRVQGGSTITQQLARNVFLNNSRTFSRKLDELLIALALERKFNKEQILELYLNKVYFGGGAYGVDSASRKFFNHPATQLSLEEAAIIAGLVKAPSRYSPTADAEAALGRAGVVLDVMLDNGKISMAQRSAAAPGTVKLSPQKGQNSVRYFTDWALPQLDILIEERDKPIEVWTTLDMGMQASGTQAVQQNVPGGAQGALVAMERDGAVRAMVGGTDYVTSNYNRATTSVRQPGSAWKLFVYLTALESGWSPEDIVTDEPVSISGWSPRNSGDRYAGDITLRTAFAYSKNTIAAKIGNELGYGTIASMARRFGVTTPINTLPSMVLGTSETRVIDMVRAFASVEAGGIAVAPYGINKVTTIDGEVLYQHKADTSNVLVPPYVTKAMVDLLQTAVNTGTGKAARIGRPVAGKTGTTNSNKDGWFLGFSSGLTTGVWMGRDDARPVGGLQGGTAPARAWAQFMRVAVAQRPIEEFDTELVLPQGISEPDDEAYFGAPDDGVYFDENGDPITGDGFGFDESGRQLPDDEAPPIDDDFIDRATGRDQPSNQQPPPATPAKPQPAKPQSGRQVQQPPATQPKPQSAIKPQPGGLQPGDPQPNRPNANGAPQAANLLREYSHRAVAGV